MAIVSVDYFSQSLMRTVSVKVILPTDKVVDEQYVTKKEYQTLYLLHGIFGNESDWLIGTRIKSWAQQKNLVVVMPAGENKFYVNNEKSHEYFSRFIGEELVYMTRAMFPLSHKREDTFIGGLSMGGYGAILNGFTYNQTFGYVIGLSSALMLNEFVHAKDGDDVPYLGKRSYLESVFGDLDQLMGSEKDYLAVIRKKVQNKEILPRVYMACGTEDFLLKNNRKLKDELKKYHIDITYEEGPGGHTWIFWDQYIEKALQWLPLDKGQEGTHSGNVK